MELFAGSCSIGKAARTLEAEVFSSDIRTFPKSIEPIHYVVDIRDFDPLKVPFAPDVIWASPPCTAFSIASCWKHWKGPKDNRVPATQKAVLGIELVKRTLEIIDYFQPQFWFIENPRGMLRKQDFMHAFHRKTVSYCQYGDFRMKPTDIWTNCTAWKPRAMCKPGMSCHQSSPRGSKKGGVSGQSSSFERSKIPEELCLEILSVCKDQLESRDHKQAA